MCLCWGCVAIGVGSGSFGLRKNDRGVRNKESCVVVVHINN